MDKKKLFAIIAAVVVLCAVVLLIVLTKSERPNENEKPTPTPAPTQSAPVPTAELTATPVPTDTPTGTPAPTEAATPEPTDEPTVEATPTPMVKDRELDWFTSSWLREHPEWDEEEVRNFYKQQMEEDPDGIYHQEQAPFVERVDLDNGGYYEIYDRRKGIAFADMFVFDTEEMPEIPKPTSLYTKDKENGTVRCAFSVQVGDDVMMEFWTDGQIYLKGTGRTWDFPEIAPTETELGDTIKYVSKDYFIYNYVGIVCNVTNGESHETGYNFNEYGLDGTFTINDYWEFFRSMHTIHIDKRITYIGKNIYEEGQMGLPYRYDFLTAVYD